jgi:hypothetical protein
MAWNEALTSQFYMDGKEGKVASGAVFGNVVTLKRTSAGAAKTITYLVDKKWNIKNLLYGQNDLAALTFREVPIDASTRQMRTQRYKKPRRRLNGRQATWESKTTRRRQRCVICIKLFAA